MWRAVVSSRQRRALTFNHIILYMNKGTPATVTQLQTEKTITILPQQIRTDKRSKQYQTDSPLLYLIF